MVIVNLILVSLNLILLAAPACAGNNRSTPQRSVKHTSLAMPGKGWQKAFTTFTNYPATVIATSDAGLLMTGTKLKNARSTSSSLWVMKADKNGKTLWEKEFSPLKSSTKQVWGSSNHGYAAIETTDGYLITGTKDLTWQHEGTAWHELWLIKLAKNGTLIWEKGYRCQWGANSAAGEGHALQETDDGSLFVSGFGSIGGTTTAWLLKLDHNGHQQWEKFLGAADTNGGSTPVSFVKGLDGYLYLAFTSPDSQIVLIKLESNGTVIWHRPIALYKRSRLGAVAATDDGSLIVAGLGDDDGLLMKVDRNGSLTWHKRYGKENAGLFAVTADKNAGFIATGGISAGKSHLWILQTDRQGVPIQDQEITGREFSTGKAVAVTSDDGYAITAAHDKGNAVWLIKLDRSGTLKK